MINGLLIGLILLNLILATAPHSLDEASGVHSPYL
jgi:hypothetical protein